MTTATKFDTTMPAFFRAVDKAWYEHMDGDLCTAVEYGEGRDDETADIVSKLGAQALVVYDALDVEVDMETLAKRIVTGLADILYPPAE